MKHSPLHLTFQSLRAQFADQNGWPVPESISPFESELAALRERVALTDLSACGKITVEGRRAAEALRSALDVNAPALAIHAGLEVGSFHLYRLRKDLFFLHTPPGHENSLLESLEKARLEPPADGITSPAAFDLVTSTDITHGRAEIGVLGPASPTLLTRLCGLDFHDSQFPNLTAKQSNVAKTPQLILRRDLAGIRAYFLVGDRSFGVYLWETAIEAGKDLGVTPVGWQAIRNFS